MTYHSTCLDFLCGGEGKANIRGCYLDILELFFPPTIACFFCHYWQHIVVGEAVVLLVDHSLSFQAKDFEISPKPTIPEKIGPKYEQNGQVQSH